MTNADALGWLLPVVVAGPALGVPLALLLGERGARTLVPVLAAAGLVVSAAIFAGVTNSGAGLSYALGGWSPPLGIALRADPLAAILLVAAAIVVGTAALFARAEFTPGSRASRHYWPLLLTVWSGVNAALIGQDLFHLFVALELLTFGAVPMVCLDARGETIAAALRYLVFALIGSLLYLLGAGLLYGLYGTLDLALLAERAHAEPSAAIAAALMTAGLLAKLALVPLHLWLPPAHASAPASASAVLSGLVVKGPFVVIVRLWLGALPELAAPAAFVLVAIGLVTAFYAVVVGIMQEKPKAVLAYSTISQMGGVTAIFGMGLAIGDPTTAAAAGLVAANHALVKGACFLAAGVAARSSLGRAPIVIVPATGLALALAGMPGTGGALAKLAAKGPLGEGTVASLAALSAAGTTLLMLHFVALLRRSAPADADANARAGLLVPWLVAAGAALIVPWWLVHAVSGLRPMEVFAPAELASALVPIGLGVTLLYAVRRLGSVAAVLRIDARVREWNAANLALAALAVALAAVLLAAS